MRVRNQPPYSIATMVNSRIPAVVRLSALMATPQLGILTLTRLAHPVPTCQWQDRVADMAYHHGDLRRALLAAAVEAIGEHGPAGGSLRDPARRADRPHPAPAHHFRDHAGLPARPGGHG